MFGKKLKTVSGILSQFTSMVEDLRQVAAEQRLAQENIATQITELQSAEDAARREEHRANQAIENIEKLLA